ncbi:Non-specific phospholipase C1 [Glycine soja]
MGGFQNGAAVPVPTSTQPNRFYVHSATSHGAMNNVRKDLIHDFPQKTIFDFFNENDLSFDVYYQNMLATLFFKCLHKLKNAVKLHDYALKFKKHALKGKLLNYVVVEQRYFDVEVFPTNDDHPSQDVAIEQMFVKEVYEVLRKSLQWEEMAVLITYDEHGGFYDHVTTSVEGVPNADGIIGPRPYYFRFDRRMGIKIVGLNQIGKKDENLVREWNHTSGQWNGDTNDKVEYPEFSNKDKTLVFQFSVKHEQKLDCGGGYMKLLSGDIPFTKVVLLPITKSINYWCKLFYVALHYQQRVANILLSQAKARRIVVVTY